MSKPTTTQFSLSTTVATTRALLDQFKLSLASQSTGLRQEPCTSATSSDAAPKISTPETKLANRPSPLPLLSVSSATLKSQVTRLSLLCINSPFTPSAVATILRQCNDSILPSLVAATLLINSEVFPQPYCNEAVFLTEKLLQDLRRLVEQVSQRASQADDVNGQHNGHMPQPSGPGDAEKRLVTELTAKAWEDLDEIKKFADEGVGGLIVRKSRQWLELMRDAVKELEEWDPEEDEESVEDLFGAGTQHENGDTTSSNGKSTDEESATIKAGVKIECLKVLTRIPQSINAIIKHRLTKLPDFAKLSKPQKSVLDQIIAHLRTISENIDESAESMYMGDLEGCLKKAGEARQTTIEVVESVVPPWETDESPQHTKDDAYVKRALEWIRQVHPPSELPERPKTQVAR